MSRFPCIYPCYQGIQTALGPASSGRRPGILSPNVAGLFWAVRAAPGTGAARFFQGGVGRIGRGTGSITSASLSQSSSMPMVFGGGELSGARRGPAERPVVAGRGAGTTGRQRQALGERTGTPASTRLLHLLNELCATTTSTCSLTQSNRRIRDP